jgi:hypothetical protein
MMPSASPTTLEKIVEVVLLYSYFGAILHSKMTLYMAQGFFQLPGYTNSRPWSPCREASLASVSELKASLRGIEKLRSEQHKKAFEYNIA